MSNSQVSGVTTGKITPSMPATTSIGRKFWMALSGVILILFVVGHMAGNLQIFLGWDALNTYAVKLRAIPALLWGVRLFMLAFALLHIIDGILLWVRNRQSRPVAYVKQNFQRASLYSRTMFWTGLGIGLYVVYHLMHYTMFITNPQYVHLKDPLGRHDVYSMVVISFQNPLISLVYIVAMVFLAFHLAHAFQSWFQTLGWNSEKSQPALKKISYAIAIVLFVGYVSIPVACLSGILQPLGGGH